MTKFRATPSLITAAILSAILLFTLAASAGTQIKSGSFYDVKISTVSKDGKTIATITITGKSGYKPNMQYPWKLTINSGPGITEKKILKKGDAKQFDFKAVVFEVSTDQSDSQKVQAELKLSLCDPKQCKQELVPLTWPE
jgi:hypothetical protein